MSDLLLTNGLIVTPQGHFWGSVKIESGRIVDILPGKYYTEGIDLGGQWLIPGCIDIHSDYIELELHPRPTSSFPIPFALHFLDIRALSCGITTVCNALSFSDEEHKNRSIEGSVILAREIESQIPQLQARHYLHARLDPKCPNLANYLPEIAQMSSVNLTVYNDHTPGERQYSMEDFVSFIVEKKQVSRAVAQAIARKRLREVEKINLRGMIHETMGPSMVIGSHDDTTAEHIEEAYAFGASLAEMPTTFDALKKAKQLAMWTSLGAPNYYRGRSHTGNISSQEAVAKGLVDILCSDYHFPSLLASFIKMLRGGMAPNEAMEYVSLNPARLLGLDSELGSIETGKQADLVAFEMRTDFAAVSRVWVEGALAFQTAPRISSYSTFSPWNPPSGIQEKNHPFLP